MKASAIAIIASQAVLGSTGSSNTKSHGFSETCFGLSYHIHSHSVQLRATCKRIVVDEHSLGEHNEMELGNCFSWDPLTCSFGFPPYKSGFTNHCYVDGFDPNSTTLFCRCRCFDGEHMLHSNYLETTIVLDEYIGNQNGVLTC